MTILKFAAKIQKKFHIVTICNDKNHFLLKINTSTLITTDMINRRHLTIF